MDKREAESREQELFQAIVPYIAANVIADRLHVPDKPLVEGEVWRGTLMFADVSGFTPISERLATLGRQGAEELTRVLNDFFTTMLDIVCDYGGDVLKFGGDAILVYFPYPCAGADTASAGIDAVPVVVRRNEHRSDDAIAEASHRALRCAIDMQETMQQFRRVETLVGEFNLTMKIGLSSGEFFAASVGQADTRVEQVVTGRTVNLVAKAEGLAQSGEILATLQTYQQLSDSIEVSDRRDGCYAITRLTMAVPRCPAVLPQPELQDLGTCLRALVPYLPFGLLKKIEADPSHAGVEGEHRRVTVMFVNFHDMSRIIRRLGPERTPEILQLLNEYFVAMQAIVHKYGGVITRCDPTNRGDKLLILFGAPVGHENDEERAVLCALEMMEALAELNETAIAPLQQRIGINTGDVFVGDVGSARRREYTVMGDAVNLAARLMTVAQQGQIIIGPTTQPNVASSIALRRLEPVRVKGKTKSVQTYEVLGRRQRDYAALRVKPSGPIIGRERELQAIRAIIQTILDSKGQLLAINGEAGVGKSRLSEELIALCLDEGMAGLRGDCLSYGATMPYLPWTALLRSYFGIRDEDDPAAQEAKIRAGLTAVSEALEPWTPLVGRILGLDVADNELTGSLDAEMRKRRFFDITVDLVRHRARENPLLLFFEDVHWIDPLSLELLNHVARRIQDIPALMIAAHRPDIELETWQTLENYHGIVLEELSEDAAISLVNSILHLPTLPGPLKELILSQAQGNPFYLEEVVRSLLDLGHLTLNEEIGGYRLVGTIGEIEIPDTIEGVIMSRVDQLPERSRNMLRIASVIGRTFRYQVLRSICPFAIDDDELGSRLAGLEALGIVLVGDASADPQYVFKHVMTQEVVYDSLLFARRRELHFRTGEAIEDLYPQRLSEYYELLALHYLRAEAWQPALSYHRMAGEKALGLYANQQAIDYFTAGLDIADNVEADTTDEEVTLNELLGDTYKVVGQHERALERYASARGPLERLTLEHDASRSGPNGARPNGRQNEVQHLNSVQRLNAVQRLNGVQDGERLGTLYRKTASTYERLGEYATAFQWLDRGLRVLGGRETGETAQLLMMGGLIHYRQGRYSEALERGLKAADIARSSHSNRELGRAYNLIGICYRRLGEFNTAIEFFARGLAVYERINDIIGIATTHNNLGVCYFYLGQWGRTAEHHQRSLEIREKIGDIDRIAMVSNNLGEVYLYQGDLAEAIEAYERSREIWEQTGYSYGVGLAYTNLGAVYNQKEDWAGALSHLSKGLEIYEVMQAQTFLPEVHRRMAEAFLGLGEIKRALKAAQRSLDLACELKMKQEEGPCRRVMGQIYRAKGDVETAKRCLQESLHIGEQVEVRYEVGQVLYQLALLYRDLSVSGGNSASNATEYERLGRRDLQGAIAVFERLGAKLDLARANEALACWERMEK